MRVLKLAVYLMTGAVLLPAFVAAQHVNTESAGARAHFVMGMKSFDMAKFDDARSHWDKAIEMDPNFAAAHLYRTWVATSADDWKAHYDRARALRESATPWVQNMIDRSVAGADNDGERQLELALALVAEYPTSARAFDYLASEYSQHKMYDAERGALKTAMALDPGYSPAYKSLSLSYVFNQPEDHEAALKYGKKYVKHAPDAADAYIVFGDVHRARNDFQKASDAYAMAIEVDPGHATAHSKKGHADTYLGAFEAARADFASAEKASRTLGQRVGQKNFAVYTHLYAGDVSAAMQANADVIDGLKKMDSYEASGPLRNTYRDRILIAAHHGMFDEAMAAHSEMVKHTKSMTERVNEPGWTVTMTSQDKVTEAFVAVKKGDIDRAKALAEEVKKLRADRNDPRKYEGYHRLVGLIALAEGDTEGAVSHLEQANMQSPLVKYELAEAHEAAGNQEKARALYQEVANYNFNSIGTAICRGMAKDKISA